MTELAVFCRRWALARLLALAALAGAGPATARSKRSTRTPAIDGDLASPQTPAASQPASAYDPAAENYGPQPSIDAGSVNPDPAVTGANTSTAATRSLQPSRPATPTSRTT